MLATPRLPVLPSKSGACSAVKRFSRISGLQPPWLREQLLGTRNSGLGPRYLSLRFQKIPNNPCPTAGNPLPYVRHSVMFTPHPNLADDVNRAIIQSEIEGGVFLHDLPPSTVLHIQTMHHCYTAVLLGGSAALISGHPEFCPDPVQLAITGSTCAASMLKLQYVDRG